MIKTAILSLSASALLFSLSVGAMTITPRSQPAPIIEGKGKPILLQRMVVTATLLPN